ncbi:MAG: acetate--CoA ligase family protein, partial [Candidatus Binataceae bacterium]
MSDSIIAQIIADAAHAGRSALSEIEAKRIVGALGINVAVPEAAASAAEAAKVAARLGVPAV